MTVAPGPEFTDIIAKYKAKLEQQLGAKVEAHQEITTKDYQQFKAEMLPTHAGWYEKGCKISGKFFKPNIEPTKRSVLQETLNIAHLNVTPEEAASFAILLPAMIIMFGSGIGVGFNSMFFAAAIILFGLIMLPVLNRFPFFLANSWRLKASNQMVLCIFYVVTYMRHTSNLELAVRFAAEHLGPPLSLDLKKVLYDVEIGQYETITDSLELYLNTWRKYNPEFIEAFHLIEGSLMEADEKRRVELIDKSLDIMLSETYEKMLHYAHNLKSPITTLHMMGIILPILGLVILPLVVSFMEGISWYHIAMLYNVALPVGVYYLSKNILSTRPTGYGDSDISETNPSMNKYKALLFKIGSTEVRAPAIWVAGIVAFLLIGIALIPPAFHAFAPEKEYCVELGGDRMFYATNVDPVTGFKPDDCGKKGFGFFEYRLTNSKNPEQQGKIIGPFGLGASILSLFFPLGAGVALGLYFSLKTSNVLEIRENAKKLENEFATALFQLGNRLDDGMPAEAAVGKVAEVMQDTVSGRFFDVVSTNIRKMGMGLHEAIFNPRLGAVVFFPSAIIESSMKVLVESIRKGPRIAAQSLHNVSRYIHEIHQVDERLRDLMAEIVSDITSQINFMTPAIAGIVIGITSMITTILGKLSGQITKVTSEGAGSGGGNLGAIASMFGDGLPTYYFQLVVGMYVVQIIYLLTVMANGIQNGEDKLAEEYQLGVNLKRSTIMYCCIALTVIILFNTIANQIIGNK
jgi:hypothetical protein